MHATLSIVRRIWDGIWVMLSLLATMIGCLFAMVLVVVGLPLLGLAIFARLFTTTVAWPNPDVVAMRERAERPIPPPPASSFQTAFIRTFVDGDTWNCLRYKSEAGAAEIRTYYEAMFRELGQHVDDRMALDGPFIWGLSVSGMSGSVLLTSWNERIRARPPYRVAVCFATERWRW